MSWQEAIAFGVVLVGLGAGAFLVAQRPAFWIGRVFWKQGDGRIIDGLGPDGVSARVVDIAKGAVRLQTGYLYHYAFAMLIGVAAFITWYLIGGVR